MSTSFGINMFSLRLMRFNLKLIRFTFSRCSLLSQFVFCLMLLRLRTLVLATSVQCDTLNSFLSVLNVRVDENSAVRYKQRVATTEKDAM